MVKKVKNNIFNNIQGFTLIELLTIISIVGLISTLMVVALNGARMKARDAKRIHDTKQIRTMAELYLDDHSFYPGGEVDDITKKMVVIGFSGNPLTKGSDTTALELNYNFYVPNLGNIGNECYPEGGTVTCGESSPGCEGVIVRCDIVYDIMEYMLIPDDPTRFPEEGFHYVYLGPCKQGSACKTGTWCSGDPECTDIITNNQKIVGNYIMFYATEEQSVLGPPGSKVFNEYGLVFAPPND